MFIYDLAKVVFGGLIKLKALGRIADARCASRCIWNRDGTIGNADRIERQIDIALPGATCSRNLTGVCLVEDVEESGPELKLLRFAEVEILEERNVKVAPARCSQVERRLRRTSIRELGNSDRIEVEIPLTYRHITCRWIGEIHRGDCSNALALDIKCVGAKPGQPGASVIDGAAKPQPNRHTSLERRDTR